MSRRPALLLSLLLVAVLVPAAPGVAGTNTDYQQVVDLTFPFTEDTSVYWPDTYDAKRTSERHHQATDLMVAYGTPIHAVVGGEVTRAGNHGWGFTVTIRGGDGRSYHYLHMGRDDRPRSEAIAAGVTDGSTVRRGQLIGYAGCSGSATCGGGEHLHLEIHDDDVVDPYSYHDHERINPWPSLKAAVDRGDYPGRTSPTQSSEASDWRFADVPPHGVHHDDIVALADAGLTGGCNASGTHFCPASDVTRAQMARFMATAAGLEPGEATFDDVPADSEFADDIAAIADAGITDGCDAGPNMFCPDQVVTRGQMAKFLVAAATLPPGDATFDDVPEGSPFADDIAAIAEAKVTLGCDADGANYCPDEDVRRAQIATFMVRAFLDR